MMISIRNPWRTKALVHVASLALGHHVAAGIVVRLVDDVPKRIEHAIEPPKSVGGGLEKEPLEACRAWYVASSREACGGLILRTSWPPARGLKRLHFVLN